MSDVSRYEQGFKNGYHTGIREERYRKNRIAWTKLFVLVLLAAFLAHFIWAVIAAYLV